MGKISHSLILIMAASALRFGGQAERPDTMIKADEWAREAGDRLLSHVFNEFGATELMVSGITSIEQVDSNLTLGTGSLPSLRLFGRTIYPWMDDGGDGSTNDDISPPQHAR